MAVDVPSSALAKWQKRVFWANWLGLTFEAYDLTIYALLVLPIVHYFHVPTWFGFVVLSSSYVTRGIGGLVFGHIADKIGRRKALIVTVLGYSFGTALTGLAWSVGSLLLWRIVTGFFVGGEYVSHSYTMESVPKKTRGFYSGALLASFPCGSMIAAVSYSGFALLLHGHFAGTGWRLPFFIGVLPAFIALWLRLGVVESPVWERFRSAGSVRSKVPLADIFRRPYLGRTVNNGLMMSALVWVYQILIITLPTMLSLMRFPHASVGTILIVVNVAGMFGDIVGGHVSELIGRRREFVSSAILCCIVTPFALPFWILPRAPTFTYALVVGALAGFSANGCYAALAAYFSERYPTAVRATGSAGCFNLGQIVGGFSPALLALQFPATLSDVKPFTVGMVVYTMGGLIVLIVMRLLGPETRGADLESGPHDVIERMGVVQGANVT